MPAGPTAQVAPPAGSVLRASLTALGAFILTVLLFWVMAPGFREAAGAVGVHVQAGPDPAFAASLGAERDSLRSRYWGNLAACRPEQEADPVNDAPPDLPSPEGRASSAPEADEAPVALEAAPPPPPPPSPPEPEPRPDAGTKPKPKATRSQGGTKTQAAEKPAPRRTQRPGEALVIPKGAADMGFLQGCWKSDAGLSDGRYHQPVLTYFCFSDAGGRATHRTDMLGPSGRSVRASCTSPGTASLSGGRLVIRVARAPCRGERGAFAPGTVTCVQSSAGAAQCTFQSQGASPAKARITRMAGRG
ncbi:MAG: hypothetical protein LBQ79_12635 [Deltaproteobacteria bacterium]|nr:hypothetical protein [Deltaproteobacteria bacterium]